MPLCCGSASVILTLISERHNVSASKTTTLFGLFCQTSVLNVLKILQPKLQRIFLCRIYASESSCCKLIISVTFRFNFSGTSSFNFAAAVPSRLLYKHKSIIKLLFHYVQCILGHGRFLKSCNNICANGVSGIYDLQFYFINNRQQYIFCSCVSIQCRNLTERADELICKYCCDWP